MEEPGASLDWCVGINMLENVRLRGSGTVHELSRMCPACPYTEDCLRAAGTP